MPERYARPLSQSEQHKSKPKIDDFINDHLDGAVKKTALDFTAWLRANNMSIRWVSVDTWAADYKGKAVCWIIIYVERRETVVLLNGNLPSWNISIDRAIYMNGHRQNIIIDEGLQNVFWNNVDYCIHDEKSPNKGCVIDNECAGGRNLTVLRKEFKNTCRHRSIQRFLESDETTVKGIKKLIMLEMKIRDEENIRKPMKIGRSEEFIRLRSCSAEQKKTKPAPEELIPNVKIDDDRQKAALDLVAFLRASKMNPGWYGVDKWKASNKGTGICFLIAEGGSLRIRLDLINMDKYEESVMKAGLHEFVWDQIHHCQNCSGCAPGRDKTVLGKELKNLCKGSHLIIRNPDETAVNSIKKLLEMEKAARAEA